MTLAIQDRPQTLGEEIANAISHGIEASPERAAKGKSATGLLILRVETNGQRLAVTIQDDGRGLDFSRIAEVAMREGILSESVAAHCSPQDLARILFRPGFSTAASVTNLSGRGMGLSVVYEAVRRLQGDLDIRPAEGGGTLVSLSVPLSIASHRVIIVTSAQQLFALPHSPPAVRPSATKTDSQSAHAPPAAPESSSRAPQCKP